MVNSPGMEAIEEAFDRKENHPMHRPLVYAAIDTERDYQREKWGDKPQSVGAFLTMLDVYVQKAKVAWQENNHDREAMEQIRKITAIGVVCGEQHGMPSRK